MTTALNLRQVTVLGLGLFGGGAGAARYFAERGARVIVSDSRNEEALRESLEALKGLAIEYHLGPHREESFAGSELVVVNPGVPNGSAALEMARRSGARLDTEINLLFRLCPAPIAAITGTNGKSTTAALLGEMMGATGRRTWVGGNLGGSLLPAIGDIQPDDAVVLEISSFQAERLAWAECSPRLGMVLNLTPNHLDRHKDSAEYAEAKRQLIARQGPADFAILNGQDDILKGWSNAGAGQKFFYGASETAPRGIRLAGRTMRLWRPGDHQEVSLAKLRLPGPHNRFNAAFAAAAAWLLNAGRKEIETAIAGFTGLPDRIELVAEKNGARWYNDSIATTPESTMVALNAFDEPIVLIAGGSSKNLSYAVVGRKIASRARAVVLLGKTGPEIEAALRAAGPNPPVIHTVNTLAEAVAAARVAQPGDVVLLSPASASFDMFRNYAERGRKFKEFVRAL